MECVSGGFLTIRIEAERRPRRITPPADVPQCAGCDLVKGHGWPNRDGLVVDPRDRTHETDIACLTDPSPDDPGYSIDDLWFCSDECGEYYLDEVMGGA